MEDYMHKYFNILPFNFEDHFDYRKISPEQVSFARYYLEKEMGIDIDSETLIEFTPIRATVFGHLLAHLVVEYEKYKSQDLDG